MVSKVLINNSVTCISMQGWKIESHTTQVQSYLSSGWSHTDTHGHTHTDTHTHVTHTHTHMHTYVRTHARTSTRTRTHAQIWEKPEHWHEAIVTFRSLEFMESRIVYIAALSITRSKPSSISAQTAGKPSIRGKIGTKCDHECLEYVGILWTDNERPLSMAWRGKQQVLKAHSFYG